MTGATSGPPTLRRVPGVPRVVLHGSGGRRARLVRSLTGASDPGRRAIDALALARVAATGTGSLPGADRWPWPDAAPDRLEAALRVHFPGLILLGAVLPRQVGRRRLSLLCHAAGNLLVVKLGHDASALLAEHRALELLAADPLPGIATPRPLGTGVLDLADDDGTAVGFVAASALGLRAQRPALDAPLRTFESDLGARLDPLLPSPEHGGNLVPVHGDLTPWNLRRTGRGLALFDWEAVGWGPPGSDVAHYRAAAARFRRGWRYGAGAR